MQRLVRRGALSWMLFAGLVVICPLRGRAQGIDEWLARARAAQASGNYSEAANCYARTTALSPGTSEFWSNRGVMEYLAGQIDLSAASLKRALHLNPRLFVPMFFLGKIYIQSGKPALALPYLDHAHALRPGDAEVLLALGKANADLNRQRQAQTAYAESARLVPESPEVWFGLGGASLEVIVADGGDLAKTYPQSIWARALYADELLAQGRPREAVDTYRAALPLASPTERAILTRNLEWMQSHPALFPLPSNSQEPLQQLYAQLKSEQGKADSPLCTTSPSLPEGAACAFWTGDYQRSADQAGQALRSSVKNAEALYWSVKANERMAVAALARFEELAPHSAKSYVMVGNLYRHQRQADNALKEYQKALAIDAHDPAALMGAVIADLSLAKLDEATEMDQAALADRPLDPQLNLLMAEILAERFQYSQGRPYLAKCLTAPSELQPRVHYLLGRADAEDGKTEEAIKQYELALPGDDDGSIHYQLSRLYRRAGNVPQAQKAEAEAKAILQHRRADAVVLVHESIDTNP